MIGVTPTGDLAAAFYLVGFIEVIDTQIKTRRKTFVKPRPVACKEPAAYDWGPNVAHGSFLDWRLAVSIAAA
jgi:hypothetical protein